MKRNCNLELRLSDSISERFNQQQELTIFYNGRMCVCDVTEIQARAIIWMASKETDKERYNKNDPEGNGSNFSGLSDPISPNSTLQSQLCSPSSSSMKKSLHRFLQKRKLRKIENSPYHHGKRGE